MFSPQYNQPFTIEEAFALDPPIITEEISRLQNSIQHLERSNLDLVTFLASETDPDVALALQDNKITIATQSERIQILQIALGSKLGIRVSDSHYAPNSIQSLNSSADPSRPTNGASTVPEVVTSSVPSIVSVETSTTAGSESRANGTSSSRDNQDDSEEGVYL
ncbi:hypothetical protein [Phaffia rhodozyma]|uniref:Uncharacterized protein n=1 Tax=Phaffia rhodozyma TaxID=264483 RepID=A0A0F7SVL5_PHARH|nr:hypothetical protein [Phaffia rhodozyma]